VQVNAPVLARTEAFGGRAKLALTALRAADSPQANRQTPQCGQALVGVEAQKLKTGRSESLPGFLSCSAYEQFISFTKTRSACFWQTV
jgi:hypothetical protein